MGSCGPVGWSINTWIIEAQAFSSTYGLAPHPPPLPSASVPPPGTKGGQYSHVGEGGANSDNWRESQAIGLRTLCLQI